jgi:galactokinase/galacturonokinase
MTGFETAPVDRDLRLSRLLQDEFMRDRSQAFLVETPLRICPLGAHVDHQGGVVTGMTIDRRVMMAAALSNDAVVLVTSLEFSGRIAVELEGDVPPNTGDWGDYVRAAVAVLSQKLDLRVGFRAIISGDLPGAGLSSSAAVLVAYLLALARVNEISLEREEISRLVQKAENEYVGVASGRLDQSIILFASQGDLTRVDCSDMRVEQVSRPPGREDICVLVAYSGVGRTLAGSGFNTRVDECREAAGLLLELGGLKRRQNAVLSDVPAEVAEEHLAILPQGPRRRAAHYFGEQRRVVRGVSAWREGDIERFGALMNASGASSIHYYESGTPELVTLYQVLRDAPGVYGARFSGGGFGGSCIALIAPDAAASIIEEVGRHFEAAHPDAAAGASFHVCRPSGPARVSDLEG